MGLIPEHVIDDVRERADIAQVVGRHVTLRKAGSRLWGLCPFHSEKTPSFQVHTERQIFYCFGCGVGGDVFTFRMRVEGLPFREAVTHTAREVGVEITESRGSTRGQAEQIAGANEIALAFFRRALGGREGVAARGYLKKRGIPSDLAERFEIGYAPPGWDGLLGALRRESVSPSLGEKAGLLAKRQTGDGHYDRFRDRVIFPIRDTTGRVLGFGGRALDPDAPKYLNTPETPLYRKGHVLFGLPHAVDAFRQGDRAVLVEGYFDLIALVRAGIREGVAPCGTAVTREHARRLRRYVREVVLLFDGDEAGQGAAIRALPLLLAEGLRVRGAFLPVGEDPDSLVAAGGDDALRELIRDAPPIIDHLLERALLDHRGTAWSAADAVNALAPHLLALPDPVERESYVRILASRLEISPQAVAEALQGQRRQGGGHREEPQEDPGSASAPETDPVTRTMIELLSSEPGLADRVTESHIESLPSTEARQLLRRVLEVVRVHGRRAIAHLLSPLEDQLGAEAKQALLRIASEGVPLVGVEAERALQDCLIRLGIRDLERRSREINVRLESCQDPQELSALLEAKQETLRKRHVILTEERL